MKWPLIDITFPNSHKQFQSNISNFSYLSSFYHHWYMKYKFGLFLTQFRFNDVTRGTKTVRFWESDLKQTPHFKVPSIIDLDLSITLETWYTTLGPFNPIWRNDVTKDIDILEFWKIN